MVIKATTKYISRNVLTAVMYSELMSAAGLTLVESKIYAALIEMGKAQAGAISRKTGIHRRNVYDALERLIEKGLVSFMKENTKRLYMASEPKKIIDNIEAKKSAFMDIMPMLESKFNAVKKKQETQFYKGIEGIKAIFEDQIEAKKEIIAISPANFTQAALPYYIRHYTTKRVERKIKLKLIYTGGVKGKTIPLAEVRHLPKQYESPVSLNVYGGTVAIIVWGIEPAAIVIKNDDVAKAFRNYFGLMWAMARKS